jgi:PHD/YefM family antitoxin component YafN of YafNO toxin-antitoxin module
MSIQKIVESAQIVIDANGTKKAILLDFALWEEILELLEDLEDAAEIDRLRDEDEEEISWEQAKTELRDQGVNN